MLGLHKTVVYVATPASYYYRHFSERDHSNILFNSWRDLSRYCIGPWFSTAETCWLTKRHRSCFHLYRTCHFIFGRQSYFGPTFWFSTSNSSDQSSTSLLYTFLALSISSGHGTAFLAMGSGLIRSWLSSRITQEPCSSCSAATFALACMNLVRHLCSVSTFSYIIVDKSTPSSTYA